MASLQKLIHLQDIQNSCTYCENNYLLNIAHEVFILSVS